MSDHNGVEQVITTAWRAHFARRDPETLPWIGRAGAVLEQWDPTKKPQVSSFLKSLQTAVVQYDGGHSIGRLSALLHQAQSDLRIRLGGSITSTLATPSGVRFSRKTLVRLS